MSDSPDVPKSDPKPAPRLHRRIFHVLTTAALALMALGLDREVMIIITGSLTGVAVALEISRWRLPALNGWFQARFAVLMKQSESSQVLGSTYMAAASLIVFLFFDKELAILALLYIAVGDPLAGVVGKRYGRVKIGSKSVEGTVAFAVGAGVVGCGMVAGGLEVPYWVALGGGGTRGFGGTFPITSRRQPDRAADVCDIDVGALIGPKLTSHTSFRLY